MKPFLKKELFDIVSIVIRKCVYYELFYNLNTRVSLVGTFYVSCFR